MLRSLFAGVSGLRNHQLMMDVIGNNISNVNTIGFKTGRVSFKDIVSQTISGASKGTANSGGTNPKQVGLGMTLGAVDTDFSQGNLQFTGKITDLAVQGEGLFKISDGSGNYYTRNGAFELDSNGYLVTTVNGYIVQGKNATAGVLSDTVSGVQIPIGVQNAPKATTGMNLTGNLDSSASQVGSIFQSKGLLTQEETTKSLNMATNTLTGITGSGSSSQLTGITSSTVVTVALGSNTGSFTYGTDWNTLNELVSDINGITDLTASLANGQVSYTNDNAGSQTLSVTVSGGGATNFQNAIAPSSGTIGTTQTFTSASSFYHTAESTDKLVDLVSISGASLGINVLDTIAISGVVGGTTKVAKTGNLTVSAGTTLADLNSAIGSAFEITNSTGVDMNTGTIKITGDGGTNYEISGVAIGITGNTNFNNVLSRNISGTTRWTEAQAAKDNYSTSIVVYDEGGTSHTITAKFNIRENGTWVFDLASQETSSETAEIIATGSHGEIVFSGDGSPSSSQDHSISITPTNTTREAIAVTIDMGTESMFDGLVSFEADSTALFKDQNGYAAGDLKDITIDSSGIIRGTFTNGQTQDLAQVTVTKFDNAAGLQKAGDSMFIETVNSGTGVDGDAGAAGRGSIANGTLEASNVDLAQEFTTMITTQRGFQTNARIISTSDQILQELVNLKR